MTGLTSREIEAAVRAALAEDVGSGDVTTLACVPSGATARAVMRAREPLVVAGLAFAEAAFRAMSPNVQTASEVADGAAVERGAVLLRVSGNARGLLTAERVALNFVQRLSGVATLTSAYVAAVHGTRARILDTRKTTPGWRRFEKYAVACGGGTNHRQGLFDMVLIKDNHLAALAVETPCGGPSPRPSPLGPLRSGKEERGAGQGANLSVNSHPIAVAVARARTLYPQLKVEVETESLDQVQEAVDSGADIIMLDNMAVDEMRAAVALINGRASAEASGGVNLTTVRAIAETGVDFISVGALTHSASAVDIGLDFES